MSLEFDCRIAASGLHGSTGSLAFQQDTSSGIQSCGIRRSWRWNAGDGPGGQ